MPTPTKKPISLEQIGAKKQGFAQGSTLDSHNKHHHSVKAQSDTAFHFASSNKVGVVKGFGFKGMKKLDRQNSKKISVDCNKYSTDKDPSRSKEANKRVGEACSPLQPHIRTIDFSAASTACRESIEMKTIVD